VLAVWDRLQGAAVVTVRGRRWRGGSTSERRRSWSSRRPSAVMVRPRQPREARSSTAQTRVRQEVSPGRLPMTLTRRRVSPKVRSTKSECRMRWWCPAGNRRQAVRPIRSVSRTLAGGELLGLGLGVGPALRVGQGQLPDLLQVADLVLDRQPRPLRLACSERGQGLVARAAQPRRRWSAVGCAAGRGQALALAGSAGVASAVAVVPVVWAWSSSEGSCAGWRPAMTAPMTAAAGSSSGSELTQVAVLPVSVL